MTKDEKRLEVAKLLLEEWKHRDANYNKHTFIYFNAIFLISVIPYIKFGGFDPTAILKGLNLIVIHSLAIALSVIAWYASHSLGHRSQLISDKYKTVLKSVRSEFGYEDASVFFKMRIAYFQSASLFGILILLNIYFILHGSNIL